MKKEEISKMSFSEMNKIVKRDISKQSPATLEEMKAQCQALKEGSEVKTKKRHYVKRYE